MSCKISQDINNNIVYLDINSEGLDNITCREVNSKIVEIKSFLVINKLIIGINSKGGDVVAYLYFADRLLALKKEFGFIIETHVQPYVCSSAILIWLCADISNRYINKVVGQVIFHPIEFSNDDKLNEVIGGFLKERVYKYVASRTGFDYNKIKKMYDCDGGFLHLDIEGAKEYGLIE